jgi:hypothetical protein
LKVAASLFICRGESMRLSFCSAGLSKAGNPFLRSSSSAETAGDDLHGRLRNIGEAYTLE